jgi:hypothetical protein
MVLKNHRTNWLLTPLTGFPNFLKDGVKEPGLKLWCFACWFFFMKTTSSLRFSLSKNPEPEEVSFDSENFQKTGMRGFLIPKI